ncbi:hypothetical protein Pmani_013590, partial [Petrolisthes manimaculis]
MEVEEELEVERWRKRSGKSNRWCGSRNGGELEEMTNDGGSGSGVVSESGREWAWSGE